MLQLAVALSLFVVFSKVIPRCNAPNCHHLLSPNSKLKHSVEWYQVHLKVNIETSKEGIKLTLN